VFGAIHALSHLASSSNTDIVEKLHFCLFSIIPALLGKLYS